MSKNLFLGFAAFVFLMPQSLWAACGEIEVAKGDIKVEKSGGGKAAAAAKGTKVCQGDTIIAGVQSRAKIKMEDGNELNVSPDSKILLETYEYKAADNKKKVMLNVMYGKVRAATREENMYNDKAHDGQANTFQVKTKSAVAGVRGTDFLTSFDTKTTKTEVVTFKGTVEVGMVDAKGALSNIVKVAAGQKTEALMGVPPTPPKPVPTSDMDRMKKDSASNGSGSGDRRMPSSNSGGMVTNEDLGKDPARAPSSTGPSLPPIMPRREFLAGPTPPPPPPNTLKQTGNVKITIAVPQ